MYEIRKLEEGDDGEDNYDEQNAILESTNFVLDG